MPLRSRIAGTGMSVGNRVVTNAEMTQWMDTTDEWIEQRTGIKERRWIDETQRPSTLAAEATQQALEQAGLEVSDIDCILLATLSGEHDFPGTAFFLHEAIDAGDIPCIDLRAQCSGFLYALQMGDALVQTGAHHRVLVVGAAPASLVLPARRSRLRGRGSARGPRRSARGVASLRACKAGRGAGSARRAQSRWRCPSGR